MMSAVHVQPNPLTRLHKALPAVLMCLSATVHAQATPGAAAQSAATPGAAPPGTSAPAAAAPAASAPAAAPLALRQIRGNAYLLTGKGGNSVVYVTDEAVVLVDDKNHGDAIVDEILAVIRTVTDKPVKYVINTHYHPDHIGNNERFLQLGAQVISHEKTREYTLGPALQTRKEYDLDGKFVRDVPWSPAIAQGQWTPVGAPVTFTDEVTLSLGGKTIRVRFLGAGHTGGDAWVFFPAEKVVAAGDDLNYPFCGVVCVDYHAGGTLVGYINVLGGLLELKGSPKIAGLDDFDIIVPGHGELSDRAALAEHRRKLKKLWDDVRGLKRAGKSYHQAADFLIKEYGWKPEDRNLGSLTFPGIWKEIR